MNIHLDFGVLRIIAPVCVGLLIINVLIDGFTMRAFDAALLPFDVYLAWRFWAAVLDAIRVEGEEK